MKRTILFLVAMSLVLMTVPTATADSVEVATCGAYHYDADGDGTRQEDEEGNTRVAVTVQDDGSVEVSDGPDSEESQEATAAFLADLEDGDADDDQNNAIWDVGPDPIDGNGYRHASVFVTGDGDEGEDAGAGTDDADDGPGGWDTTC